MNVKQKILITGSCGFIFSNFIRKIIYLSNKDPIKYPYNIVSLDKVSSNAINSIYWNKNHTFHIADITDQHIIDTIFQFEKPDIVIHGAAETFVDTSLKDPNSFISSNVLGTQVIINACVKYDAKKLIYISCYDQDTAAVTRNGIKKYNELKEGDLVLSINPETGIVEEKEIEKIIVQDYDGDMYHFKSKRSDFLTTPNHRYLYSQNNFLKWTTAEEMSSLSEKKYFPKGSVNVPHKKIINIPELGDVDSNALFYVCGAFIGDGFTAYQEKKIPNKSGFSRSEFLKNCRNNKGQFICKRNTKNIQEFSTIKSWRIFFDVPQNDKCRKKLEKCLKQLNIRFHSEKNRSGEHIYISSEKWSKFFDTFGKGAINKHIPEWMFNYSKDNLYNLLMGCHDSDGHGFNIKGRNNSITTISPKLRDQLCYLISMTGFHPKYHKKPKNKTKPVISGREINSNYDAWVISFSNIRSPIFPKPNIIKYSGKIWCLKVKDNKNFLVERNGIIGYSGNTDEIYGQLSSESEESWTEESPMNPRNPYAATKAAGELLVKAAHQSFGIIYNITRTSNNYGPRQNPEKLIPKAIKCIMDGQKIPIYGEGKQIRDWTHVFDNCAGIMTILRHGAPNEIYNISANQEFTNIEVIQNICNIMGKGHNLIDFIKDPRGNGHDFRYAIDCSKIKKLGWSPNFKFKDGLAETIEWYLNNQWFIK